MNYIKSAVVVVTLALFVTTATPAQASTLGDLQNQLISLLNQFISLLTKRSDPLPPVVTPPTPTATTTPDVVTSTAPYTLSDVVSVTTKGVDPIPGAIDDEYTLYTITLKDGTKRLVEAAGFAPRDMVYANFYKSGFTGDVEKLMTFIAPEAAATQNPTLSITSQTGRAVTVTTKIHRDTSGGIPAVAGPVSFGTISWGDGTTEETLSGLLTNATALQAFTVTHTYTAAGTYNVTITDISGKRTTKAITVQ